MSCTQRACVSLDGVSFLPSFRFVVVVVVVVHMVALVLALRLPSCYAVYADEGLGYELESLGAAPDTNPFDEVSYNPASSIAVSFCE